MKKKYLFLLLFMIFLSSSVAFKAGYQNSEKIMINVFESSKTLFSRSLTTQNNKFAYLTDSHVEKLDGNRYQVDSYVDFKNDYQQDKRVRYTMILSWNGQEYEMENLRTAGQ